MKKNYLEPAIEVHSIALQSLIAASIPIGGEATGDADIKNQIDFAEDIESDLFGGESFGGAEEW